MSGKERTPFGKRLFDARTAAGLKQKEVSAKVGMAQGTLAEAEWIRDGSTYTAQLAALYEVRPEWLAKGTEPMREVSTWPFPEIDRGRFDRLSKDQKLEIQGAVRNMLTEFESKPESQSSGGGSSSSPDTRRRIGI